MSDPLWINRGGVELVGNASIAAATEELTISSHGLNNGDPVMVDNLTGGAVGVLFTHAVYFVRNATTNTFILAGAEGGNVKDFAADGTANVYVAVPRYNASELRRAQAFWLFAGDSDAFGARSGVRPHSLAPIGVSGTTWTVNNLTAVVYPGITTLSGPYVVQHPEELGSINAADGANDRIDALDLEIEDDDEDASGERHAHVIYTAGTPAGSPSAPTLVSGRLRLGTIAVSAGGTPSPFVLSTAQSSVASGGILPVIDSGELPIAGLYDGMAAWDIDERVLLVRDNGAWREIAGTPSIRRVGRTTNQSIPNNSDTAIGLQSPATAFTVGISPFTISGTTQAVIARNGVYRITASVCWEGDGSSWRRASILHHPGGGGGTVIAQQSTSFDTSGISQSVNVSTVYLASAGDEFSYTGRHNVGSSLNVLADPRTSLTIERLSSQ